VNAKKIARVALDVPTATLFDYRANEASAHDIGRRVLVPFGRHALIGVLMELADTTAVAADRLKHVIETYRDAWKLEEDDLRLLRFVADYYHYPLGPVVMSALPAKLRRRGAQTERTKITSYSITPAGLATPLQALPPRATLLRRLLAVMQTQHRVDAKTARSIAPTASSALRTLIHKGWISTSPQIPTTADSSHLASPAPTLTPAQQHAVHEICVSLGTFRAFLLMGVTGSGKTEVYLHAIQEALNAGRQALLLVPEIALTPQLEATISARFPSARLASLHSRLNEGERYEHWLRAQRGDARIVIGTRLAIFTPMPQLGLMVIDEEQDASFKQTEGLCYSARDVAIMRARQRGIPIVLGSATPSAESYYNAERNRYTLLELRERINACPPLIRCIDTRRVRMQDGLSLPLLEAIAQRLQHGEQTLVFINRRGYAPVLMCHACGWLSGCHRCSAQLVLHATDRRLRCHHCGHESTVPVVCPECGNADLSPLGQGTQRVEQALAHSFPAARILRIDRDTTRRKESWRDMRQRIFAGEVDILVGTQILAKGHDFPRLSLVGVLNADSMLYSADFRASERLFALLTQVAGRAGRDRIPGEVLVQTEFERHPLYAALRAQDVHAFCRALLAEREQAAFPPYVHQALLRAEAPRLERALEYLREAAHAGEALRSEVVIYDPIPASLVRLAGRERAQLLVQSPSRPKLHAFLRAWREKLATIAPRSARWALDVDPLDF
jgi:primosomal protein N' (replication factor Y) (superfamily II helicase)